MGIALIAIVAIITTASVSLPAVYGKKHHHFTDTQKEDSTASDANGNPCDFGPAHDECGSTDLSKEPMIPIHSTLLKKGEHSECEDEGGDIGLVCHSEKDN